MPSLLRTPLYPEHVRLNARLVPFAGFEMPVQYSGISAEHTAVRERAGLFDVSHMGELWLRGAGADALVDSLVTNQIGKLPDGKAAYTCCCNEGGTILDDLIVYRFTKDRVLVVCNASNRDKISGHFREHAKGKASFEDESDRVAADSRTVARFNPSYSTPCSQIRITGNQPPRVQAGSILATRLSAL